MNQEERRKYLIQELLDEREEYCHIEIPQNESSQKLLLRDLMNVREPKKIKSEFYRIQDAYLQTAIEEKGIVDVNDLKPIQEGIYLWQGDITTLKCDAIVNAANSQMTGCYIPHHRCIDNCIHSYAGMQLRYACYQIMEKQQLPACPVETTLTLISDKWKVLILRDLLPGTKRFGELKKSIGHVSQKVLTAQLRQMEQSGLLTRTVYPEVPPRVEYSLTELGYSLKPILDAMSTWGENYKENYYQD